MGKENFVVTDAPSVGDVWEVFETEDEAKTVAAELALDRAPHEFFILKILATVRCDALAWDIRK